MEDYFETQDLHTHTHAKTLNGSPDLIVWSSCLFVCPSR